LRAGDAAKALSMYRKALEIRETLKSADPSSVQLSRDLARAYFGIGNALALSAANRGKGTDDQRQAINAYEESLSLWSELRDRGVLKGEDLQQPEKVKAALEKLRSSFLKR
jgi:tetratricopeptide (TPR) repeat protein